MAQYRHVNEYADKCFENARLYKQVINVKSMHINILYFQGYILYELEHLEQITGSWQYCR